MIQRSFTRRSTCGAVLAVLAWVSAAGATGLDDVADRQLGQPSFFTRAA